MRDPSPVRMSDCTRVKIRPKARSSDSLNLRSVTGSIFAVKCANIRRAHLSEQLTCILEVEVEVVDEAEVAVGLVYDRVQQQRVPGPPVCYQVGVSGRVSVE